MPDTKLRKQRTSEDMMSANAGQCFSPPTFLYDAACCAQDADRGRTNRLGYPGYAGPYSEDGWRHRERLQDQTIEQGCSTYSRVDGDFDYIGGQPDELLNGK